MTDETPNPFEAVKTADLPSATTKTASPETIALGKAALSVMNASDSARDTTAYKDRDEASKRQAALKRAVKAAGGAPAGSHVTSRIVSAEDGYRVVLTLVKDAEPSTKRGKNTAD